MKKKYSILEMIDAIQTDTIEGDCEVNDDGFITKVDIKFGVDYSKIPGADPVEVNETLKPLVKKMFLNIITEKDED